MRVSIIGWLPILGLCLALSSCATVPSAQGLAAARLRLVDEAELARSFGPNFDRNPFIEPSSLLTGKPLDYAVLELALSLPSPAYVEVEAELVGLEEGASSTILDARSLRDQLSLYDEGSAIERQRDVLLQRLCLPGGRFMVRARERTYFVVVACRHPYPPGAGVKARVTSGGVELATLDEALPAEKMAEKTPFGR